MYYFYNYQRKIEVEKYFKINQINQKLENFVISSTLIESFLPVQLASPIQRIFTLFSCVFIVTH